MAGYHTLHDSRATRCTVPRGRAPHNPGTNGLSAYQEMATTIDAVPHAKFITTLRAPHDLGPSLFSHMRAVGPPL